MFVIRKGSIMTEITDLSEIITRGRIRGIGNRDLTPQLVAKIGAAHGTYVGAKGTLVIGREYNNNNRMLKRAFISGVMSAGVDILNLHSAPIPVLQFCIRRFGASGGVYFSTGSSQEGEVTIRFFDSAGVEYNQKNVESINEVFKNDKIERVAPIKIGSISDIPHTHDIYKKAIPQFINRKLFQQKPLRVVLDCSYGPTGITAPSILSDLNVDVIAINSYQRESDHVFPNMQSIKSAVQIVRAAQADLGVVLDSDGSRSLYIDDTGTILSFEDLMMLFISYEDFVKKAKGGPIVFSKSASRVLGTFVTNKGYKALNSDNFPGEMARSLREERACLGGADTLKFYFPQYGPFSDATFTTLKILEILAANHVPLSALIKPFPRMIHAYKSKPIQAENLQKLTYAIKAKLHDAVDLDFQDIILGTKILYKDLGWVTISPSIQSATVEMIAESFDDPANSEKLIEKTEKLILDGL
jgi:mannose-1-phosphate guanylyltransferase/phosphomannomutase